ncbi:alanyl-tRNA synthetase [Roseibium sp. TrichSKD4]|uniref:hypothetical protein n=1 Tax=Roseibium sp. TrichSKD4 TaxID=744980 RepID=UPI0001E56BDA|nr:hypothetical protein [Roseibium sp. TrichSKD4]EFO30151.1 alanyl-tRNA synthetase [Roseibium sp. TrichSKD4]
MDDDKRMTALVAYLRQHNLNDWAAIASFLQKTSSELEAENKDLKVRIKAAEAANELDRSRVARALTALNSAVRGRQWVLEGRGPYEWDDDDYRAEFSLWVDDVQKAAELFAIIARDWHGCPMDATEIRHARAMLAPTMA